MKTAARKIYGLYGWFALILVTIPMIILVAFVPGETRRRGVVRRSARLFLRLTFVSLQAHGLQNIPDRPCVVVANHASYLDGIILMAVLPPRFAFVIKREMTRVPIAHFLLRRIGSAFVERHDAQRGASDARRILARAALRESLAFFPEGTFHAEPGLRRFHPGAFAAAVRGQVPVVPVAIRGSRAMLPAEKWLLRPARLDVIVMPRLEHDGREDDGDPVAFLLEASRRAILAALPEPDATI